MQPHCGCRSIDAASLRVQEVYEHHPTIQQQIFAKGNRVEQYQLAHSLHKWSRPHDVSSYLIFDSADVCIDFAVTKVAALFVSGGYHTQIHRYDLYIVAYYQLFNFWSSHQRKKGYIMVKMKKVKSDDLKYSTVEYYYLYTLNHT